MIRVGGGYEQVKADLITRIREKSISAVELEAENHACYFCRQKIHGKMVVLVDMELINSKKVSSMYFIDNICYEKSKAAFYHNGFYHFLN